MMPGLIVPVVNSPESWALAIGVCIGASTMKIMRLKKSEMPRSTTFDLRYGMLYCNDPPHRRT